VNTPGGKFDIKVILGADYNPIGAPTPIPLVATPVATPAIAPSSTITR
jgi:hypothetical protein